VRGAKAAQTGFEQLDSSQIDLGAIWRTPSQALSQGISMWLYASKEPNVAICVVRTKYGCMRRENQMWLYVS
jgi:hypothetical protein